MYFLYHNYKTLGYDKMHGADYEKAKRWAEKKGMFTAREFQQGNRWVKNAEQAQQVLVELQSAGTVEYIESGNRFKFVA